MFGNTDNLGEEIFQKKSSSDNYMDKFSRLRKITSPFNLIIKSNLWNDKLINKKVNQIK